MTSRIYLAGVTLLAACFLTGCNDPSAKLAGKWKMSASGGSDPLMALPAGAMNGDSEFKKDGSFSLTLKTSLGDKAVSGSWRFVEDEGKTLVIATKTTDGPENKARLQFTDDDHFSTIPFVFLEVFKDSKLYFVRKQ